jgi:SNF2 family DNA or RNA helicase
MENFGVVRLEGSHWVVRCEPHVRARLKRVFPRAPQQAGDEIRISRSPEHSRELEWFLQRYPMYLEGGDIMSADSAEHRQMERRLSDLIAHRDPPPRIALAEPPREYQEVVPQYLDIRRGLLLADDLGLGKTVSATCCCVDPEKLPAVIVTPPHLMQHWQKFLARFAPHLKTHIIKQGKVYSLVKRAGDRQRSLFLDRLPDVIIVSYFRLRSWADQLGEIVRLAIFEECQQLRRPSSEIYTACEHLAAKATHRLGMSATPIFNYGNEFFHVVNVLSPGCLGTYEEFIREWCTADHGDKSRIKDTVQFGAYLRREGIMLRRTRKEVGRELPKVTKIVHEIESDAAVIEKMTGNAVALARTILRHNERYRGEKMQAAGEFDMLMRQATGIAKAPYVAEFVRLLVENGEKVILFGWHRAVYDIWMERLKDLNPVLYTGSESTTKKEESKRAFIEGDSKVMIMSLRAGVGVDGLQYVSRTEVFGELDWSPGVHEQNIGRVDRDGQVDPVTAYFLVSDDGSDPVVANVLGIKREQIEGVRNPDLALTERVDTGENNLRLLAKQLLDKHGLAVEEKDEPLAA